MKSKREIRDKIKEIRSSALLKTQQVTVKENANLALKQVQALTSVIVLEWVLQ